MSEAVSPIESALTPRRIGEQCRATGLGIVNNAHRWGKAELAGWLSGPYSRATLYAPVPPDVPSTVALAGTIRHETRPYVPLPVRPGAAPEIALGQVEALLEQLHEEITIVFRDATLVKIDAFSRVCVDHGFVVQQSSDTGEDLYLPVNQPRMRLLERVVSLFAADALMSLESYATVRVCDRCGSLTFGSCSHASSGWQTKGRRIPRED